MLAWIDYSLPEIQVQRPSDDTVHRSAAYRIWQRREAQYLAELEALRKEAQAAKADAASGSITLKAEVDAVKVQSDTSLAHELSDRDPSHETNRRFSRSTEKRRSRRGPIARPTRCCASRTQREETGARREIYFNQPAANTHSCAIGTPLSLLRELV